VIQGLVQFGDRLDQLRASLEDVESANRLAAFDAESIGDGDVAEFLKVQLDQLRANTTARRVYAYASCTSLLYGAFEQFVETLLMEYLEEVNRLAPTFSDLPQRIRENHAEASARLILNLGLDKYRNRTSADEVARRLASCADGPPYQLNTLAYIDHAANLRIEAVKELFKAVGVSGAGKLVAGSAAFEPYLKSAFPDGGVEGFRDGVVFRDLSDLVDRRNIIAHGWPDDVLSVALMEERIEFVRLLGRSLHEVLEDALRPYVFEHASVPLPAPLSVFNDSIVCFRLADAHLRVGSTLIARCPDGRLLQGEIMRMEVDNAPVDAVVAPPTVEVGCRVDLKARQDYEYFAVIG